MLCTPSGVSLLPGISGWGSTPQASTPPGSNRTPSSSSRWSILSRLFGTGETAGVSGSQLNFDDRWVGGSCWSGLVVEVVVGFSESPHNNVK